MDISRLENDKFQLFKDKVNIRSVIKDVCDIMKFQVENKKLSLI